jgi:predicted AAA+ superfamily ATPase
MSTDRFVTKPSHVFDRDDDWSALVDFATDPSERVTLGVVSGRRRQGKTYLLSALAERLGQVVGQVGFFFVELIDNLGRAATLQLVNGPQHIAGVDS